MLSAVCTPPGPEQGLARLTTLGCPDGQLTGAVPVLGVRIETRLHQNLRVTLPSGAQTYALRGCQVGLTGLLHPARGHHRGYRIDHQSIMPTGC